MENVKDQDYPEEKKTFSIPGANAYGLLQDLLKEHPVYYAIAEQRYNEYFCK